MVLGLSPYPASGEGRPQMVSSFGQRLGFRMLERDYHADASPPGELKDWALTLRPVGEVFEKRTSARLTVGLRSQLKAPRP